MKYYKLTFKYSGQQMIEYCYALSDAKAKQAVRNNYIGITISNCTLTTFEEAKSHTIIYAPY
jgi:hypothetical protein